MFVHTLAVAQAEGGGAAASNGGSTANPLMQMMPMVIIMVAIMYFFMFRPQQKREKERREMLAAISKGDKVLTNGGIVGTVVGLNEKTVVLRVAEDPNVKIEFLRAAVSRIITKEAEAALLGDGES